MLCAMCLLTLAPPAATFASCCAASVAAGMTIYIASVSTGNTSHFTSNFALGFTTALIAMFVFFLVVMIDGDIAAKVCVQLLPPEVVCSIRGACNVIQ
mmetsp:Transcript_24087/g.61541  ORF Transcript_24087/g.61541 Transcript_24087/m.61541 type:complete len:98 (-) Transcript_24087:684-977(-)